jgi:hypothetical protein
MWSLSMKTVRRLNEFRINDIIKIDYNPTTAWKVESIRDSGSKNGVIDPDTVRRHPDRIRSRYLVRLRNTKTGRLRSVWNAEYIHATLQGDILLSDHAKQRSRNRKISESDIDFVVRYGKVRRSNSGNVVHYIPKGDAKHFPDEYRHLGGVTVVKKNNIVLTCYYED